MGLGDNTMNPITAKATELRVLQHHAQQLQIQLSKLDQGLSLAGIDPHRYPQHILLSLTIRSVHRTIGELSAIKATAIAEMYEDNRGLTP